MLHLSRKGTWTCSQILLHHDISLEAQHVLAAESLRLSFTECLALSQVSFAGSTWRLWLEEIQQYIDSYSKWALQCTQKNLQPSELVLVSFCADMTQLCQATLLEYPHICSVMNTVGQLSVATQQHRSQILSETSQQTVHQLMRKLCKQLWPQRHRLQAQHVAIILTALSRTDQQMDAMPGLADALADQFIADSECHNAHRFANTLYSCSQLEINPCDGRLVQYILQRLPKLSLANFSARNVANAMFGVAQLPAGQHPASAVDKLCNRMIRLMSSSEPDQQPTEDDLASVLRSLEMLQHQPKAAFNPALLTWYTQLLTHLQNQSPPKTAQRAKIILTACANLRLEIPPSFTQVILPHVFAVKGSHPHQNRAKARANAAWALAALGTLDLHTFKTLFLTESQPLPWSPADQGQLHRALDWLQPESEHHSDYWECRRLRNELGSQGQRLHGDNDVKLDAAVHAIGAALEKHGIPYAAHVYLGGYCAHVVIEGQGSVVSMAALTAVLDVVGAEHFFKNKADT